jgi:hypothetical protein
VADEASATARTALFHHHADLFTEITTDTQRSAILERQIGMSTPGQVALITAVLGRRLERG